MYQNHSKSVKSLIFIFIFVSIFSIIFHFWFNAGKDKNITNNLNEELNYQISWVQSKQNKSKPSDELSKVIDYLYMIDAFLVDIDLLTFLLTHYNDTNTFDYEHIMIYTNTTEKLQLTFGLFQKNIQNKLKLLTRIKSDLYLTLGIECDVNEANNRYTNFYINCKIGFIIQLVIFNNRGNFLWIDINDDNYNYKSKWFGDLPRAINNFTLAKINDKNFVNLYVPSPITKFLYEYKHSIFVECDKQLAESISTKHWKTHGLKAKEEHLRKEQKVLKSMNIIASAFEHLEIRYYLYGGTLLGWYRDCGLQPHANDVDFSLFNEEYNTKVFDAFDGNKDVWLLLTFGSPKFGYEMRLTDGLLTYDIFFTYTSNTTHKWTGFYVDKTFYKQWLDKFDLCSGEMNGYKFIIVCDPRTYLRKEYGNWEIPAPKDFKWLNVDYANPIHLESNGIQYHRSTYIAVLKHTNVFLSLLLYIAVSACLLSLFVVITKCIFANFYIKKQPVYLRFYNKDLIPEH